MQPLASATFCGVRPPGGSCSPSESARRQTILWHCTVAWPPRRLPQAHQRFCSSRRSLTGSCQYNNVLQRLQSVSPRLLASHIVRPPLAFSHERAEGTPRILRTAVRRIDQCLATCRSSTCWAPLNDSQHPYNMHRRRREPAWRSSAAVFGQLAADDKVIVLACIAYICGQHELTAQTWSRTAGVSNSSRRPASSTSTRSESVMVCSRCAIVRTCHSDKIGSIPPDLCRHAMIASV